MIAAEREHAEAAQQIEIALALAVVEVLPLPLAKSDIIADGPQHADHLLIETARMQAKALGFVGFEQGRNVDVGAAESMLCRSRRALMTEPSCNSDGQQCGIVAEIPPETNIRPTVLGTRVNLDRG